MLESIAWYAIFSGAVYATAGLVAGLTVVGIPAGVIRGAVGIWEGFEGTWLLWWTDTYYVDGSATACWYAWW